MSNPGELLKKKIATDKEILSVMPQNTKKNRELYYNKVSEICEIYENYLHDIIVEMKRRAGRIKRIIKNSEIEKYEEDIKKYNEIDLFATMDTAYEKMKIDEVLFTIRRFYKNNLEQVNNNIEKCLKMFENVGIEFKAEDFNYSPFTQKYMSEFLVEYKKGDVNSQKMKDIFEKIYWECSDIIIHIELNIRYLYLKNQKDIEKYFALKEKEMQKEYQVSEAEYIEKYKETREKLDNLKACDRKILLDKFLNKEWNTKEYEESSRIKQIDKMLIKSINEYSEDELNESIENILKLEKTLEEYKNYLNYKFVLDKVLKIYAEKDKYKNSFETLKKEIQKIEGNLSKLNKKYYKACQNKGFLFIKKDNIELVKKLSTEINNVVLQLKDMYRNLDLEKVNQKISTELTDNSSLFDALFMACSYYTFLVEIIMDEFSDSTEEQINEKVNEIRNFITNPYINVLNNINIKEDKNMVLMIKDKYNLFNINISKDDLDESAIDTILNNVKLVVNGENVKKSQLNLEDIEFAMKANKLLT